jgi:hypothetical protein
LTAFEITSRTTATAEYATAELFRLASFASAESYLYPGRAAWTLSNLEAALFALKSREDAPAGSSFLSRLKLQLDAVSEEVHIVVAESLLFYYLFPDSQTVRKDTKIARVAEVLSWKNFAVPRRLEESFGDGVGGVGTHYMSAQPYVMGFILEFVQLGKLRKISFDDPSQCQDVADGIRASAKHVGEARHALLHLLFPDIFEPIVSERHKARIVEHFKDFAHGESDPDVALRAIRTALSADADTNISFYGSLRSGWDSSKAISERAAGAGDSELPSYERIMLPLLQLIADGELHKESDLISPLASEFELSVKDIERRLPSGPQIFPNRVTWAKVNLRQAALLDIPTPGFVRITQRGIDLLGENFEELSRQTLKRYPEYVTFLNRSRDSSDSGDLPGNIWIEKTLVRGRSDRENGEYALGKALWSPKYAENGRDIYRFMRDVRPGDIILHFTDNKAITGVSYAEQSVEDFIGLQGTDWEQRPSMFVRLRDFRKLEPPLSREAIFAEPYAQQLVELRRSGQRNLFFTEDLELVQGGYLTPVPPELASILNDAYMGLTGEQLIEAPSIEAPPEAPVPAFSMDDLLRTTLWSEEDLNELLDALSPERSCKQIILAGPPGTGKTWVAQQIIKYLTNGEDARWRLVQFHPSYSYEQFIEGLRPEANGSAISFRPVDGILLEIATRARSSGKSHFLLIDEMNRANLPRVLGELLYLFEYRKASIDLPYTRNFTLPENLFFVGTMNTADRSIRSIDAAMRRRFELFECLPNRSILGRYYQTYTNQVDGLIEGFDKLNELLTIKLDRHHTIGHTFFMAPVFSPKMLERTWRRQVKPLIEEYFFDQPDQSEAFELNRFWPNMEG